jgi:hypothetical protein
MGMRGTLYCRQSAQIAAITATEPIKNIRRSTATGNLIRSGFGRTVGPSVTLRFFFPITLVASP